jgi:hypothetical protein
VYAPGCARHEVPRLGVLRKVGARVGSAAQGAHNLSPGLTESIRRCGTINPPYYQELPLSAGLHHVSMYG